MRFRKKPVVIEALQFTGRNHDEIAVFCQPHQVKVGGNFTLIIPTLEGDHTAIVDDWIVKGIKGEVCPVKPDIFEATYEPVDPLPVPNQDAPENITDLHAFKCCEPPKPEPPPQNAA